MFKSILSVIVGYLAMIVPIIILFSVYTKYWGPKPGWGFILVSLVIGLADAGNVKGAAGHTVAAADTAVQVHHRDMRAV